MSDFQIISPDFVNLQISTTKGDDSFVNEKRLPKDISVSDLKAKLELLTGGNSQTMEIEVYNKENGLVCKLSDNRAMLGSYPIENGMRLHVIDKFSFCGDLENSDVEKYVMKDEEYANRSDSVRSFLLKNRVGKYGDEYLKKKSSMQLEELKLLEAIEIGSRCKVAGNSGETGRLGTVMYKGLVEGLQGQWIGVKYDEPMGKNDGSLNGKRYFECTQNYGTFVKPVKVTVGDFPEEEYGLNDEI